MEFQALDGPIYYLFLILGLVFALAGLALIFKGKSDENAARIEMFGMKFHSSSAGTLVFLIGVAFLLIPLFVPRAERGDVAGEPPSIGIADQTPGAGRALVLPQTAEAEEVEPNDTIDLANQFALGFGAKGNIDRDRDDFSDWYLIDTRTMHQKDLRVQIRSVWGGCRVIAFDANEEEIDDAYCDQSGGSRNFTFFNKENDRVYLRILFNNGSGAKRAEYEVFLRE